jgi:indolepyruvate ferredoxin oxidoreductase beta subunit
MSNMETKSIMIVGVGGQGTLLSSRLLGAVLTTKGYDVKVSEVHGMSQRGGSVVTYVKYGDEVYSPIIEKGEADYILSFEQLEAARWLPYLKQGGKLIVNTQKIDPMPVVIGAAEYPQGVIEAIAATGTDITSIDALSLAVEAGSSKAVNVVLMGVLASKTDIAYDTWVEAVKATVPAKFLELNLKAFDLGYNFK